MRSSLMILFAALSLALTACATPGFAGEGPSAAQKTSKTGDHAHHDDHDEPRPFDKMRDASADVDAALARASDNGTLALIVMGGNWCHDSRAFAAAMERPETQALIEQNFELTYVDVGFKTDNQHIARRLGLDGTPGTPTVVVARGDGTVLNAEDAPTWRNAASRTPEDIHQYFAEMAKRR